MKPRCEFNFLEKIIWFFLQCFPAPIHPILKRHRLVLWLASLFRKQSFSLQWIAIAASLIATRRTESLLSFCIDANKKLGTQKRVKVTVPSPMPLLSECVINCDKFKPMSPQGGILRVLWLALFISILWTQPDKLH